MNVDVSLRRGRTLRTHTLVFRRFLLNRHTHYCQSERDEATFITTTCALGARAHGCARRLVGRDTGDVRPALEGERDRTRDVWRNAFSRFPGQATRLRADCARREQRTRAAERLPSRSHGGAHRAVGRGAAGERSAFARRQRDERRLHGASRAHIKSMRSAKSKRSLAAGRATARACGAHRASTVALEASAVLGQRGTHEPACICTRTLPPATWQALLLRDDGVEDVTWAERGG